MISRHLPGQLVKFYGVEGTGFFHWFFPFEPDEARMQKDEMRNTEEQLKVMCSKAARELNIIVYGGECIQAADGSLSIIDFNDWPSFGGCRAEVGIRHREAVIASPATEK